MASSSSKPLPKNKRYHFNVIYHKERSRMSINDDTKLSLEATKYFIEKAKSWGYDKSFYEGRDALPNKNVFDQLFDVINSSCFTIVIFTNGFLANCWFQYSQMAAFKTLMDKPTESSSRLIFILLGINDKSIPQHLCLNQYISFTPLDWKTKDGDSEWNKLKQLMDDPSYRLENGSEMQPVHSEAARSQGKLVKPVQETGAPASQNQKLHTGQETPESDRVSLSAFDRENQQTEPKVRADIAQTVASAPSTRPKQLPIGQNKVGTASKQSSKPSPKPSKSNGDTGSSRPKVPASSAYHQQTIKERQHVSTHNATVHLHNKPSSQRNDYRELKQSPVVARPGITNDLHLDQRQASDLSNDLDMDLGQASDLSNSLESGDNNSGADIEKVQSSNVTPVEVCETSVKEVVSEQKNDQGVPNSSPQEQTVLDQSLTESVYQDLHPNGTSPSVLSNIEQLVFKEKSLDEDIPDILIHTSSNGASKNKLGDGTEDDDEEEPTTGINWFATIYRATIHMLTRPELEYFD